MQLYSMRAKALAVAGGNEPKGENWDYSVKPITGNEVSTTGKTIRGYDGGKRKERGVSKR